jgi:hypothetical protein
MRQWVRRGREKTFTYEGNLGKLTNMIKDSEVAFISLRGWFSKNITLV